MNIFKDLAEKTISLVRRNIKAGTLTEEKISYLLNVQKDMLDSIILGIDIFSSSELSQLVKKYYSIPENTPNRHSVNYIFPTLLKRYTGKALAEEKTKPFGAILSAAKILKKINVELQSNLDTFIPNESITIYESKISTVALLGVLRETDLFINYSSYLWSHFVDVVTKSKTEVIGYRAKYLIESIEIFVKLVNDINNTEYNYSFVRDINIMKKKNADLILYANNQTFDGFVDANQYSGNVTRRLTKGIAGFGVVGWLFERWDDYKYCKYLKDKNFKAWLENQSALLRLDLMKVQYDSPEYQRLIKTIDSYNNKISEYDNKLQDYENEE